MLIDGEKYACEACVRGHRVSSCQHSDRPLQHINKKGRPVSQCPHCRGLRKSRATHAACECGSKPHRPEEHHEGSETTSDPNEHKCCCSHGTKCTCALKKEPLDPVPEMTPPAVMGPLKRTTSNKKPRLAKAESDNSIPSFATPARPTHRYNDSAHQLGMSFKVPIPHSIPPKSAAARRSTDSLPLLKRKGSPSGSSLIDLSRANSKARISKSEQGSPGPRSMDQLGPVDFNFNLDNLPQFDFSSTFYSPQEDTSAIAPYDMSPPSEWPAFDAPLDDYTAYHHPPQSYGGLGQQPLASSSGEVSDISDYLSQASRPQLSAANSSDSSIRRLSPALYPTLPHNMPTVSSSDDNLSRGIQPSSLQAIVQNRPQNLSSDESLANHLSPATLANAPQHRSANLSSDESLASRLSSRSHLAMSHAVSPVDQPFQPPPTSEAFEESFLPPTSSPKRTQVEQFPQVPFGHNKSGTSSSSFRPPTSSPKQPQESLEAGSPSDQKNPHPFPPRQPQLSQSQSAPAPAPPSHHPTELTPAQFSQIDPDDPASGLFGTQPISSPDQLDPPNYNAPQPIEEPGPHPIELTPAEFSQANPPDPSANAFAKPGLSVQQAQRMAHPEAELARVHEQLKSPAVGGSVEDFTQHGWSVQDAQRLAHPQSSEVISGSAPGRFEKHGMSVHDAQRLAHPETGGHLSSSLPAGASLSHSDALNQPGLSVPDAQRRAHPITPTEALSGLTIPQSTSFDGQPEEKNVWAARGNSPDSATSYVSQQEVEGSRGW